ncbi:hypothetical protein AOQ84DRAFT_57952 [Glonium stellatum]|uniref:CCR4-NOT transcription complex subunit 11 n=1 Tax=Glonium stellatum TaxID=574774 RepID=A0A8E2EYW7_9PEZI|nr:hypothetical protein AOQ84DRAFT_57952 [Glonium stellatum]
MDVSSTLAEQFVTVFSDYDRSLQETGAIFESARNAQARLRPKESELETLFQDSLKLKRKLDELEGQVTIDPSLPRLAAILNCEYQLYKLNEATPLRHNPFLSHWVEVVQRWEKALAEAPNQESKGHLGERNIEWRQIYRTRIEFVKAILSSHNLPRFFSQSPKSLHASLQSWSIPNFDTSTFITILEDEGIYEKTAARETALPSSSRPHKERQNTTQVLLSHLESSPATAIPILTRLPLDLPSLDLLTKLLQNRTLEGLSIDPVPVIRDYVQHSLRLVERMSFSRSDFSTYSSFASERREGNENMDNEDQIGTTPTHDREAQIRAVKLLLLFIRNLIRKALLPPEDIYFEIQEICVRYVWIKEVREFRAFIEQGTDVGEG